MSQITQEVEVADSHNEVIELPVFELRMHQAIQIFVRDAYCQRPYEQSLAKWVDDFQEWLTIDEVTKKENT